MKKIVYVLAFWLICILSIYLGFYRYTTNSYGIKTSNKFTKLDTKSEEIINLTKDLTLTDYLRYGFINTDELTDEIKLKQILYTITDKDYKELTIRPTKVMCLINDNLWFMSVDPCKVRVIEKDKIQEYMMKLFNSEDELNIDEIEFDGFHCKLRKKYYCHMTYYKSTEKSYSYIDRAFKDEKDNIYIYEYYLHFDYNNDELCHKYYTEEFCNDKKLDIPEVDAKKIIDDGVYYRHIYKKNKNGEYYLYNSEVVK